MKNKILLIILTLMLFIGMGGVKAENYSSPQIVDGSCEMDSDGQHHKYFYYKYSGSIESSRGSAADLYINDCEGFGDAIKNTYSDSNEGEARKTEIVKDCKSQLKSQGVSETSMAVRVGAVCRYKINNGSTNNQVFCLEGEKALVEETDVVYELGNTISNTGLACGLVDAYNAIEKLRTDSSLWRDGELTLDEIGSDYNSLITEIQKKVWSHQYDTVSYCTNDLVINDSTGNTIKFDLEDSSSSVSPSSYFRYSDIGYYYSTKIKVVASGLKANTKITLSLEGAPEGSIISKSYSQIQEVDKVASGDSVYVLIPAIKYKEVSSFGIKAVANIKTKVKTTLEAKFTELNYKSGSDSGSQKLGIPKLKREKEDIYENVPATQTLNLNVLSRSIELTKVNNKNKNNIIVVPGAIFSIKYYDPISKKYVDAVSVDTNTKIEPQTTNEDGKVIFTGLRAGKYKITEESAPKGYEIGAENPIEIEITTSSPTVTKKTVINIPKNIKISKQDVSSEKEISGAEICVYKYDIDEDKKLSEDAYECFTSGDKPHEFYVEPGTYILEEKVTPEGYDKIETGFVFTVSDDFTITLKDVKSKLIQTNEDKDMIILYNTPTEVPVEPTGRKTLLIYIIGAILVIAGGALSYFKYFRNKVRFNA